MPRLALLGQALLLSNSLYATLYSPINGGGGLEQSDLQVSRYHLMTNIEHYPFHLSNKGNMLGVLWVQL